MNRCRVIKPWVAVLWMATFAGAVPAQQVTGVPGSPSATTTLNGRQLPPPDPKFGGVITEKASESTPWWRPRVVPPKGAPNVLLIMTDDSGFGAPSTFGGVVPTPALDRVAKSGLRYTNFHSTSLCSPTRAALITGRNHHSVGFGVVGEIATGYPGYDSTIPIEKGTIGTILRDNGYATSWFGKNHNTPFYQGTQAGPFDQWPIGMGFEYFYGFVGGDASQWQPNLFRNTTAIYPFQGNPDWNLTTAMADEAIQYMKQHPTGFRIPPRRQRTAPTADRAEGYRRAQPVGRPPTPARATSGRERGCRAQPLRPASSRAADPRRGSWRPPNRVRQTRAR
jgi:arylsulfatase A-like enzyme